MNRARMWDGEHMSYTPMLQIVEGIVQVSSTCVLMWWTGALDEGGMRIYEGDVIEDLRITANYPLHLRRYEVIWRAQFCGFALRRIGEENLFDLLWGGKGPLQRVIGNRYEHPELLSYETKVA